MGARFSAPVQTGPGAHTASCTVGTASFPVVKSGRGVTLTPHPLLVTWSKKSRVIPLLPLWAVRPVQSLSACTRVTFTFFLPLFIRLQSIFSLQFFEKKKQYCVSFSFSLGMLRQTFFFLISLCRVAEENHDYKRFCNEVGKHSAKFNLLVTSRM